MPAKQDHTAATTTQQSLTAARERLAPSGPNTLMRSAATTIASDFETFRQSLAFPFDDAAVDAAFRRSGCEALHFAPQHDCVRRPYARGTTRALLFVAAAYLAVPLAASREAAEFGIRLCSLLFFTQPRLLDVRTRREAKRMEEAVAAVAAAAVGVAVEQQQTTTTNVGDDDADAAAAGRQKDRRRQKGDPDDVPLEQQQQQQQHSPAQQQQQQQQRLLNEDVPQDRLARIPIAAATAVTLLRLCNGGLLSTGAASHFAHLKRRDAFALQPAVRYADVALAALTLCAMPAPAPALAPTSQHKAGAMRPLFDHGDGNNATALFLAKVQVSEGDRHQQQQQQQQQQQRQQQTEDAAAAAPARKLVSLEAAMEEYENMKDLLGMTFDDADADEDDGDGEALSKDAAKRKTTVADNDDDWSEW